MKLIINADDYGRSNGITDNTFDCIIAGSLNSVSIPSVGHGFEYGLKLLKSKKLESFRRTVHLDLVEGPPILKSDMINMLVDKKGNFKFSFLSLWMFYLISTKANKINLKNQVKLELKAQIDKYLNFHKDINLQLNNLNVDSHQHMHIVPFVFDIVMELSKEYPINYIRLPNEKWFLCIDGISSVRSYLGPNLLKHFILKYLSKYLRSKYQEVFKERDIKYPDFFIGVLFTGYMTFKSVKNALEQITKESKLNTDNITVEFLFHPCKAIKQEEHLWDYIPGLKSYYFSSFRDQEASLVKSSELKNLLQSYK